MKIKKLRLFKRGTLVITPAEAYLERVKLAILLAFLLLGSELQAQLVSIHPERLITLELLNGEHLSGRVVDADSRQLHLVGSKVNRLIPFSLLAQSSARELGLSGPQPVESSAGEFQGLNTTRQLLRASQEQLGTSRGSYGNSGAAYYPLLYPLNSCYRGSSSCFYRHPVFSGGLFLRF